MICLLLFEVKQDSLSDVILLSSQGVLPKYRNIAYGLQQVPSKNPRMFAFPV